MMVMLGMISGLSQARLYFPSSRGTQSQTVRAESSIIPYSTDIHRRDQDYEYILGGNAGEEYRRLLERRSGEWRLTRKQTTSRPDTLWPEIWKDMSEASKRNEKQKWAVEKKKKLDNSRKLRGIYFIDPDDGEFKDIMKNAPMPAAMLCKLQRAMYRETCSVLDTCKTEYACIVEADESTIKRKEGTLHNGHEDHIAGKGMNSLSHYNLVHKFIPMPQALKIPRMAADESQEQKWDNH